jgi:hypothetical protein
MYKLEFTLKQHTPLIHFQHDQSGATLRATEVKPKLDFFIMKKLLDDPSIPDHKISEMFMERALTKISDGIDHPWKKWLAGKGRNEHVALDYKLRFESQPGIQYLISSRLSQKQKNAIGSKFKFIADSPFFAEEESIGKLFEKQGETISLRLDFPKRLAQIEKLGIISQDENGKNIEIKGVIVSTDLNLLKVLNESLIPIFIQNNFGNRQNKGFGCFSVTSINKEPQINNYDALVLKPAYKFSGNIKSIEEVFRTINTEYKRLKTNAASKESELRDYFKDEYGIEWEKKAIYNHVNGRPVNKDTFQYVRSYLGLAELFDFRHNPVFKVKLKHLAANKDEEITRFQSPITFKYFDGNLYLMFTEIPEKLKNQQFEFRFEDIKKETLVLNTPSVSEDFMSDFLNEKLNKKDWRKLS